jgi:hypothetical protein
MTFLPENIDRNMKGRKMKAPMAESVVSDLVVGWIKE